MLTNRSVEPPDVLLQVVMDQATSLETMLPIEGTVIKSLASHFPHHTSLQIEDLLFHVLVFMS